MTHRMVPTVTTRTTRNGSNRIFQRRPTSELALSVLSWICTQHDARRRMEKSTVPDRRFARSARGASGDDRKCFGNDAASRGKSRARVGQISKMRIDKSIHEVARERTNDARSLVASVVDPRAVRERGDSFDKRARVTHSGRGLWLERRMSDDDRLAAQKHFDFRANCCAYADRRPRRNAVYACPDHPHSDWPSDAATRFLLGWPHVERKSRTDTVCPARSRLACRLGLQQKLRLGRGE